MTSKIVFALAFAAFQLSIAQLLAGQPETSGLSATWELVSMKCGGDSSEMADQPKERKKIKLINGTHFVWAEYERASGKLLGLAGGTFELKDTTYTEKIEFASDGFEGMVGRVFAFEVKVLNGRLMQSGMMGENMKLEEVWQKAAPTPVIAGSSVPPSPK
jgi:hypothetical protein